jgi:zona occludens toxin (predicted ATPase)
MRSWLTWILALVAAPALSGCSPSEGDLEEEVADKSGVVRVDAHEAQGDDFIPFADPPAGVDVRMESDVTTQEVMSVFEAYYDDIDNGDVDVVTVVLEGTKHASLVAGLGTEATEEMVEDLVAAQHDEEVVSYARVAIPARRDVEIELVPLEFHEVAAIADRYREDDDVRAFQLDAGPMLLIWDSYNENLTRTAARERFVLLAEERYRLGGASVAGRGPLDIFVAPGDIRAVSTLAARSHQTLGKVRVHALDGPRLP